MARNYTLKAAPVVSAGAVSASRRNAGKTASSADGREIRKSLCGGSDGSVAVFGGSDPSGGSRGAARGISGPNSPLLADRSGEKSGPEGPDAGLVICGISHRETTPEAPGSAKNRFLKYVYDQAPVVGFKVMKRDVVTVRAARNPDELAERLEGCKRGEIEFLSMASRRRLALVAANTHVVFRSFVTVTYPKEFPCDGKDVKRHLDALMKSIKRKCPGVSYLWFLEFQRRGAPHFHVFLSVAMPEPLTDLHRKAGRVRKVVKTHRPWQVWLSDTWYRIVGSGDEKHLRAGAAWEVLEKPDACSSYVAKEAYKTFQKVVPPAFRNVGRFWGTSRDVPPSEGELIPCTVDQMKRIFGEDALDDAGNPFPVMFGAAVEYEKIRDTKADPVKMRAWKSGPRQKDMHSTLTKSGDTQPDTSSQSGVIWKSCAESPRIKRSRNASDEWHGSTLPNTRKRS